ncbi:hypothetical protein J2S35_000059 [Falsarthrobacter nasiphocae]|uniref:Mutator family transposase n=1 Tax=Falsarthrobacter nasiphocae TaxID=189863 RepID=A0AAE3YCY0_9MICC|nr:hypothetical protein [Falsarthrobacter nasiphocae]
MIASTPSGIVVNWVWARAETRASWQDLIEGLPAPEYVVIDGAGGMRSALSTMWPSTKVQRCLFHVHASVRRHLTSRPRLPAGRELFALSTAVGRLNTPEQARAWTLELQDWNQRWGRFLQERTRYPDGTVGFTHERLRRARHALNSVVGNGTAFTYLADRRVPRTTSWHEGGINAQLRALLRLHRGMPLAHRMRALDWWLALHGPAPLNLKELLMTSRPVPDVPETDAQMWEATGRPMTYGTGWQRYEPAEEG